MNKHFGCPFFELQTKDCPELRSVMCMLRVLGKWWFSFEVTYEEMQVKDFGDLFVMPRIMQAAKRQAEMN